MKSKDIKERLEEIGHDPINNEFANQEWDKRDEFMYQLNGLIEGEFFHIETDSKKVIKKITDLMD